jgi:hypothetical protein
MVAVIPIGVLVIGLGWRDALIGIGVVLGFSGWLALAIWLLDA